MRQEGRRDFRPSPGDSSSTSALGLAGNTVVDTAVFHTPSDSKIQLQIIECCSNGKAEQMKNVLN